MLYKKALFCINMYKQAPCYIKKALCCINITNHARAPGGATGGAPGMDKYKQALCYIKKPCSV